VGENVVFDLVNVAHGFPFSFRRNGADTIRCRFGKRDDRIVPTGDGEPIVLTAVYGYRKVATLPSLAGIP
jgi:hypothetical protein